MSASKHISIKLKIDTLPLAKSVQSYISYVKGTLEKCDVVHVDCSNLIGRGVISSLHEGLTEEGLNVAEMLRFAVYPAWSDRAHQPPLDMHIFYVSLKKE